MTTEHKPHSKVTRMVGDTLPCERHAVALAEAVCVECLLDLQREADGLLTERAEGWRRIEELERLRAAAVAETLGALEQVDAMQRELEQWSVGLGPGPERIKELREAQRGR